MDVILWIAVLVACVFILWVLLGAFLNYRARASKYRREFLTGRYPAVRPIGFYEGVAHLLWDVKTSWLGKAFDHEMERGWNLFMPGGLKILKVLTPFYRDFKQTASRAVAGYYFETVKAKGFKDGDKDVMLLDYSSKDNPFLIRWIVDEIVEVGDGEYLGVVYFPFLPKWSVTVGYFRLRK